MTAPPSTDPADSKPKIDLKVTQVAGAALGAVTAAVAGSQLGTAGTLIGAAGASMVYTVTSAVYRASLERSREKVRALAQRTRPLPISRDRSRTGEFATMPSRPGEDQPSDDLPGGQRPSDSSEHETPPRRVGRLRTLRWATVAVGSIGGFLLAMMVITGFEWTSGKTLGGGTGTTVGRVVQAPQGPRNPAGPPAPSSSSAPTSQAPTQPPETTTTSPPTTTRDSDRQQSPPTTSKPPATTTRTPIPLLPNYLPGPGDR